MRWRVVWGTCLGLLFVLAFAAVTGWLFVRAAKTPGWTLSPMAQREERR